MMLFICSQTPTHIGLSSKANMIRENGGVAQQEFEGRLGTTLAIPGVKGLTGESAAGEEN